MLAYGRLKFKPSEFYELDLMEFEDIAKAYEEAELARRWETAYWVCTLIGPHLGKNSRVNTQSLMKPFLPKEEIVRTKEECNDFFENFYKQRKEVVSNGNGSRVSG